MDLCEEFPIVKVDTSNWNKPLSDGFIKPKRLIDLQIHYPIKYIPNVSEIEAKTKSIDQHQI
jgi:hypothetical protein